MNSLNGQPQISCVNKLTGAFITFPTDGFLHEQMEDVVEQDDGDEDQKENMEKVIIAPSFFHVFCLLWAR